MSEKSKSKLTDENRPVATLDGVGVKLIFDTERFSSGSLLFRFADTRCGVLEGEVEIGTMGAALGGTMFVEIEGRTWVLDSTSLFNAVRKVDQEYQSANPI